MDIEMLREALNHMASAERAAWQEKTRERAKIELSLRKLERSRAMGFTPERARSALEHILVHLGTYSPEELRAGLDRICDESPTARAWLVTIMEMVADVAEPAEPAPADPGAGPD